MYKIPKCQSKLRISRHHCKLVKMPSLIEDNIYNIDQKISKFSNSYLNISKDNSHSIINFRREIAAPSVDKFKIIYSNETNLNSKKNNSFSSVEKNTLSTNSNSSTIYINIENLKSKLKKDQNNQNFQILVNRKPFIKNNLDNSKLNANNELRSIAKRYQSYGTLNISNPASSKSNSEISNVIFMRESKSKKSKNIILAKPITSSNNILM